MKDYRNWLYIGKGEKGRIFKRERGKVARFERGNVCRDLCVDR